MNFDDETIVDLDWLKSIIPFIEENESGSSKSFSFDIHEGRGQFLYFMFRKRDGRLLLNANAEYGGTSGYHVTTRGRLLALLFALGHEVKV